MSDSQIKRQITSSKRLRAEIAERLVERPWDSESAMHLIGINKAIETLWYMLGNEAKYEEGMSPYIN